MPRLRFVLNNSTLAILLLGSPLLGAQEDADQMEEQFQDLSGPSFKMRESSMRSLLEFGDDLLPKLNKMSANAERFDPELKWRLHFLRTRILTKVDSETDAEVLAKVDEFRKARLRRKQEILNELLDDGEWRIVFGLYLASTDDLEGLAALEEQALQAIRELARAEIQEGNEDEAEKLLRRGALFPDAQRSYAAFLVESGRPLPQEPTMMLELHYLILEGEFKKAEALARKFGLQDRVEAIQLAVGDYQSLLEGLIGRADENPSVVELAEWLKAENQGTEDELEDIKLQLVRDAKNLLEAGRAQNPSTAKQLTFKLASMGEISIARRLYEEVLNDGTLASYRDSLPSPGASLNYYGLKDLSDEGIRSWFKKVDLFDKRSGSLDRKATFPLYGLLDDGKQPLIETLLREKFEALPADKRQAGRLRFLSEFGLAGLRVSERPPEVHGLLYSIACDVLEADEEAKVLNLAESLLRPTMMAVQALPMVHEWGREMHPEFDRKQQLQFDLAILRYGLQAESEREQWVTELLKHLKGKELNSLQVLIEGFIAVSDPESAWRAYQLNPADVKPDSVAILARHLLVSERWSELANSGFKAQFLATTPLEAMRIESRVLSASDEPKNQQRAKQLKKVAALLVLGEQEELKTYLGDAYKLGADDEFLNQMQKLVASGEDDFFHQPIRDIGPVTTINYWTIYYELLIRSGDYPRAIALAQDRLLRIRGGDFAANREQGMYPLIAIEDARCRLDFARGLHFLQLGKREQALAFLENAVISSGQATLNSDVFFPALAQLPEISKHFDGWFKEVDATFLEYLEVFPRSSRALNGRAWMASRAARNLERAEKDVLTALGVTPTSGPLMDTLAEVKFAQGERKVAIEISERACRLQPYDQTLTRQLKHFRKDPLPRAN